MSKLRQFGRTGVRWYSGQPTMVVNKTLEESLEKEEIKHRNHPGRVRPRTIEYPKWFEKTMRTILEDYNIEPNLVQEKAKVLRDYLHNRRTPNEKNRLAEVEAVVRSKLETASSAHGDTDVDLLQTKKARRMLKHHVYNWMPIDYTRMNCLAYAAGRSIAEYSALYRIFQEIVERHQGYQPRSFYDFGSGTCTALWAASHFWRNSIKEYICIDTSTDMNELAQELLKGATPKVKNVYWREFLPSTSRTTYDVVVCAYSLLELPSMKSRVELVAQLFNRTEDYLVIVEKGNSVGFMLVNEARDYVLSQLDASSPNGSDAHVFAPCPHDLFCPMFGNSKTNCHFGVQYTTIPISGTAQQHEEIYSYVVIKKGKRPENDEQWARIIKPVMNRSKHVVCHTCTQSGKVKCETYTKTNSGLHTYRCVRSSEWGDRLPFVDKTTE